ncbi:dihydrodipicolinate synthase family protein [Granulosicoccus sp.]|nr:dihydrodipicolinate synthase family protein [Granulosicoccus sp.]
MTHLSGLSAFTLTPFSSVGVVDVDHLQRLVTRLTATEVDSIGVLGSTGSYMYLNSRERARAIASAVEAGGDKPILAGIGDLRTDRVIQHATNAEAAGASALLLAPVSYLPLSERDFSELVRTIASSVSLPICLYNNPVTTHFTMTDELVASLANLPMVKAVKNPAPSMLMSAREITAKRADLPEDFVLGYSGDALITHVLSSGADAWYSVIAGTLPELALEIWSARKEPERLSKLQAQCEPLWKCFNTWGSIRVVPEIARMIGLGTLKLALPLQPLEHHAVTQIEEAIQALEYE